MKPAREHATNNSQTYFVTSDTWERRALFRNESWARLFFKNLLSHRAETYLLHEFVLMPDHFHLLITPSTALERAVQLIKGGFSFQVKRELGFNGEVWRRGFSDHRVRDAEDYDWHVHYIHLNPVKKHLCDAPSEYRYSSAYAGWKLDPIPQWLKPLGERVEGGTAKAVPFQSNDTTDEAVPYQLDDTTSEAATFQNDDTTAEAVPVQNNDTTAEAVPVQNNDTTAEAVTVQDSRDYGGMAEAVPSPRQQRSGSWHD